MKIVQLSAALLLSAIAGMAAFSYAQMRPLPEPPALLTVTTSSIPKSDTQEVRILTATLPPGATSTWHTHPSPPFVYVIEGAIVIESEARLPIEVKAGRAIAEPTGEVIRAVNRGTVPTKLVIFYVAPPPTHAVSRGSPALKEESTPKLRRPASAWPARNAFGLGPHPELGTLWLSLGATSWVIPGWMLNRKA